MLSFSLQTAVKFVLCDLSLADRRDLCIILHPLTQLLQLDTGLTILTATMQPLSRQISERERVIRYYRFVTIIDLQYNFLADKDQNGSGRLAITILLQ
jgi:hypothetical protein